MKYLQTIIAFLLISLSLSAQTPMSVLDAVASNYNKKGDTEIAFTLNSSSKGTIKLSGQKFNISLVDMTMWFNGSTLWTYVKENQEVNVTNPTDAEIAKINPSTYSVYRDRLIRKGIIQSVKHGFVEFTLPMFKELVISKEKEKTILEKIYS